MIALLLTAFTIFAASGADAPAVTVVVAPDQPAPHIYIGDPLILEFQADKDCTFEADVEIRPEFGGESLNVPVGAIKLQADGPQWRTIDGVSDTRGRYFITTRVKSAEGTAESNGVFCRSTGPAPAPGSFPSARPLKT